MRKYSIPEIYFTYFNAEEHITMSGDGYPDFDMDGIEDYGSAE